MFVMFWAAQLAQSVYGLSEKSNLKRVLRVLNNVGKGIAIVLPLITILCLRAPAVQANFIVFILIADLPRQSHPKPQLLLSVLRFALYTR
jgi:hypothetical protein